MINIRKNRWCNGKSLNIYFNKNFNKFVIWPLGEPNNAGGTGFSFGEGCAQLKHPTGCMNDRDCAYSSSVYICKMGINIFIKCIPRDLFLIRVIKWILI